MLPADDDDVWKPFSKEQWIEWQEMAQATDLQLMFSLHKFKGCSAVQSARLAGYSGSGDTLKKTAYDAARSVGVAKVTQFVMACAPIEVSKLTEDEVDRVIAGLVRSRDPQSIKVGVEQYEKRKTRVREAGEGQENDGLPEERLLRQMILESGYGAAAFLLLYRGGHDDTGHAANAPLLVDLHHKIQQEGEIGKQVWDWSISKLSPTMQECLQQRLDPSWQLDTRLKIWHEIGKKPPGPVPHKAEAIQ